jgi:hypothetical protein
MVSRKASLLLTVLASCCLLPVAATAQQNTPAPVEPLTEEEMLVVDGQAYAKAYGVTVQEAMRRILVMTDTTEAVDALAGEFAGRVGGQFFTHGSDFG